MEREHYRIKDFIPRSLSVKSHRVYLSGSPSSGKTTLALMGEAVSSLCYINLMFASNKKLLQEAKKKLLSVDSGIKLIVIDNYREGFLDSELLSQLDEIRIILIGKYAVYKQDSMLRDFSYVILRHLSFEEYLASDTKNLGIESLFGNFIQCGNAPEIYHLPRFQREQRKWQIMRLALEENLAIFCAMLSFQSLKITTNSLYTQLKNCVQISKDRLYPLIEKLQDEYIISVCEHTNNIESKHKRYKLYFYDFSLFVFADNKHFLRMYENMVYLELIARGFMLCYDDYFDFLDKKKRVYFLCMPFASLESIQLRIKNLQSMFTTRDRQLIIVSMSLNKQLSKHIDIVDFTSLYNLSTLEA
ncbi:ATP-binding protein [Helicobacter aurati]|uniref:ATP-binding protein n=1 Tax=Helicobacter aurati TaxID=137778 RepID=A0A3D8J5V2_9HELI|nr:ATP-binding protein [Helicobacter aurati]RDU72264.1 ATP-binding protein [Helicobacter aurati]